MGTLIITGSIEGVYVVKLDEVFKMLQKLEWFVRVIKTIKQTKFKHEIILSEISFKKTFYNQC